MILTEMNKVFYIHYNLVANENVEDNLKAILDIDFDTEQVVLLEAVNAAIKLERLREESLEIIIPILKTQIDAGINKLKEDFKDTSKVLNDMVTNLLDMKNVVTDTILPSYAYVNSLELNSVTSLKLLSMYINNVIVEDDKVMYLKYLSTYIGMVTKIFDILDTLEGLRKKTSVIFDINFDMEMLNLFQESNYEPINIEDFYMPNQMPSRVDINDINIFISDTQENIFSAGRLTNHTELLDHVELTSSLIIEMGNCKDHTTFTGLLFMYNEIAKIDKDIISMVNKLSDVTSIVGEIFWYAVEEHKK